MPDNPITAVHRIDDVNMAGEIKIPDKVRKAADGPQVQYVLPKDSIWDTAIHTLLKTAAGANVAGKVISEGEQLVSYMVPELKGIKNITDLVGQNLKQKINTMDNPTVSPKPSPQPSTIKGVAIFVSLLALVGVHLDAAVVGTLIGNIITGVTLAVPAIIGLWEIVRDEVF